VVAAPPAFAMATIRPGDRVIVSTRIGAVTIEREVTALQAAKLGEPLFVRADDGAVFVGLSSRRAA
jgi:hypothetical protein